MLYGVNQVGIVKNAYKNINLDIILTSQLLKNDNMFKFSNTAMKIKPKKKNIFQVTAYVAQKSLPPSC